MTHPTLSRRGLLRGGALLGAGLALAPLGGGRWGAPCAWAADLAQGAAPSIEGEWPQVTTLIDDAVASMQLPCAIACLGWGAGAPGLITRGTRGFGDKVPVDGHSLARVYSMTKPLTGMIAMMLVDEGRLGMDQPLADFVPEFAAMRVVVDPAKGLDAVPAHSQITIRHLLTHTSGLGYAGVAHDPVSLELGRQGLVPARIAHRPLPNLFAETPLAPDEFLRRTASVPLLFEPGTKWSYSMGVDVLGLVIERITGKGLEAVMTERLFGPLGMHDSFFTVPASAADRLITNYGVKFGISIPLDVYKDSVYLTPPAFAYGGSGLVTTPLDYDRFLAMLAGGGLHGTTRIMSAQAVAMGTSNLLPAGVTMPPAHGRPGDGHGAGGRVGLGDRAGLFGWSGAAGTQGFIDTRLGLRAGLFVQYMPTAAHAISDKFGDAVRADLLVRPPADIAPVDLAA